MLLDIFFQKFFILVSKGNQTEVRKYAPEIYIFCKTWEKFIFSEKRQNGNLPL